MFTIFFGDSPETRAIDYLFEHEYESFTMEKIRKGANLTQEEIEEVFPKLVLGKFIGKDIDDEEYHLSSHELIFGLGLVYDELRRPSLIYRRRNQENE